MIIYIVTNTYFNDRDKDRFGVDFFLKKNYKVVILDVQNYTNPELNHLNRPACTPHLNMELIACDKFETVKHTIKKRGSGVALLFLSDEYKDFKIKRYLQQNNIKIGVLHIGMIPVITTKESFYLKIRNKIKKFGFIDFMKFVIYKLYSKIFHIKYYDFLVTPNYTTSLSSYDFPKPLDIIETHSSDYDLFLRYKDSKNTIDGKYVVFLDQYLLNHSDFLRMKINIKIPEDRYYIELNTFFKKIEEIYNYKVIIAAHPRADRKNYRKLFNNREIIYKRTALLVKYSEFVVTHDSTAINFAILYKKPIVFMTSKDLELERTNEYLFMLEISTLLNQDYVNISSTNELALNLKIDSEKYNQYKRKYIKNNDINMFSYEIFYNDYLKRISLGR